jgi:hypothetical protein
MRISTFTAEPLALARYKTLLREDGSPALTVLSARAVKDGVIARVAGIDSKDAADALRGLRLYVAREALPEPDEDEFYLADLIGLAVAGGCARGQDRRRSDPGRPACPGRRTRRPFGRCGRRRAGRPRLIFREGACF